MDIKKYKIPQTPGCYRYMNAEGEVIYIGKAANLRARVLSYWRESANHTPAKQAMLREIASVNWIETESEIEALLLEANLVKKFQPRYNIDLRDDKRFAYIKISTADEIPGVFITRKIDKQGKYFGPFTSAGTVREVVKIIRKVWPYCTERTLKPRPCFYAQIGRCTGVCAEKYPLKEYKEKIIKPIILFLSGKKKEIIKKLEVRSKKLEKELRQLSKRTDKQADKLLKIENELKLLKYQLANIKHVLECTNVIGVAEKYAADVVELAKVLDLAKVPVRIEGYDISNIFGKSAVGSMVVFKNGEPDKSEYKKFKIRVSEEMGDTGMLREVLERRLGHTTGNMQHETRSMHHTARSTQHKEDFLCQYDINKGAEIANEKSQIANRKSSWPDPDLIIIDGGKGQLNIASKILKQRGLDIPVLAISKGEGLRSASAPDKIFFPGEKKPLELPLASPALHIIKRVRDEAHRFAIRYHRELRSRNMRTKKK